MKKIWVLLTLPFLRGISIAATSTDNLISYADQAIAKGTVSLEKLITTMQTIHKTQKEQVTTALKNEQISKAEEVLQQWDTMYVLTTHLYDIAAGSGKTIQRADGTSYTFKTKAPLSWMNISRGEVDYYSFPKNDHFLEIQWNMNASGATYVDTSLTKETTTYMPKYFYAGGYSLQDLTRKSIGLWMMDVKEDQDLYYFFDLPQEIQEGDIVVTSGSSSVKLSDLYEITSYSPGYFVTSLDDGFQFCQKVSEFVGSTSSNKEYSAKECSDAAQGKFYATMHTDILSYAADTYL